MCIVAVLAAVSVAMVVVTHFNMNSATHEGTQSKPKVVKCEESTSSQPTPGSTVVTNGQPQLTDNISQVSQRTPVNVGVLYMRWIQKNCKLS